MAVAVGLTPEMLPMIVTVCLSKGAVAMGRKKVIVKRLNAIQNLGAMDVLCTDKTGTLTMDQVILEEHCDVVLKERRRRARAGVHQQPLPDRPEERPGPRGARARPRRTRTPASPSYAKVDEIPFDFQRRIMSVVVRTPEGQGPHHLARAHPRRSFRAARASNWTASCIPMDHLHIEELKQEYERLSADGFRVLAIATRRSRRERRRGRRRRRMARPTSAT